MSAAREMATLAEQAAARLRSAPPGGHSRHLGPRIYAGLMLLMAYGQSVDLAGFETLLGVYQVGVDVGALAVGLVAAEWVLGVWLLLVPDVGPRVWSALFAGLWLTWAGLAVSAFVRGLEIANCACFGTLPPVQALGWPVLVQDAVVVAAAGWFVFAAWRYRELAAPGTGAPAAARDRVR